MAAKNTRQKLAPKFWEHHFCVFLCFSSFCVWFYWCNMVWREHHHFSPSPGEAQTQSVWQYGKRGFSSHQTFRRSANLVAWLVGPLVDLELPFFFKVWYTLSLPPPHRMPVTNEGLVRDCLLKMVHSPGGYDFFQPGWEADPRYKVPPKKLKGWNLEIWKSPMEKRPSGFGTFGTCQVWGRCQEHHYHHRFYIDVQSSMWTNIKHELESWLLFGHSNLCIPVVPRKRTV